MPLVSKNSVRDWLLMVLVGKENFLSGVLQNQDYLIFLLNAPLTVVNLAGGSCIASCDIGTCLTVGTSEGSVGLTDLVWLVYSFSSNIPEGIVREIVQNVC